MIRLVDGDTTTILSERALLFALLQVVPDTPLVPGPVGALFTKAALLGIALSIQHHLDAATTLPADGVLAEMQVNRIARPSGNGIVGA